eukprot:TRINITY_DN2012_c2_g1_i2.p1 TRINITY_DN2012_c2_g1~~TRINITY_DN2012_c2_g1_i2.p1  ORF type:complete len:529 (-),score=147.75 TRINITY_DN2012_c2_g1_i2:117-1703(-)
METTNNNAPANSIDDQFVDAIIDQLQPLNPNLTRVQISEMVGRSTKKTNDYTIMVAKLNKFGKLPGNPAAIAADWASKMSPNDWLSEIAAAGPLVTININKSKLLKEVIRLVVEQKEKYGCSKEGNGETVVVEFSSPNIAKPFHAGHLRSTIIGNFLQNIHRALGYNVVGINYLGDWGKQYGLLAVGYDRYGSEEQLKADAIRHLYDIYVKINADAEATPTIHDEARLIFKGMEEGDEKALGIWKRFRDLSIEEYKKIYQRLNVHFDVYAGESLLSEAMEKQFKALEEKGLLTDDKGARMIDLKPYKLNVALVKKTDGTTLYITRDIAAAYERFQEYKFKKMFYVVAAQQNFHFQQLFKILELMGYEWANRCQHISFGMVKGMSTRKGTVVFLQDILTEANREMREIMEKNQEKFAEISDPDMVADVVGMSAVFIQDMSAGRNKDYEFAWDRVLDAKGHTGPYLQFAHARLCGVERKAGVAINLDANLDLVTEREALDLAVAISKYPPTLRTDWWWMARSNRRRNSRN